MVQEASALDGNKADPSDEDASDGEKMGEDDETIGFSKSQPKTTTEQNECDGILSNSKLCIYVYYRFHDLYRY